MAYILIVITLVLISLHISCGIIVVDQELLDRTMKHKIWFFTHDTTVEAIYGNSPPTLNNFNPGETLLQEVIDGQKSIITNSQGQEDGIHIIASEEFIMRDFMTPISISLVKTVNDPTKPFLLSIVGDSGSGKTTLIDHLNYELLKVIKINSWAVKVNVPDLIPTERIEFDDLLQSVPNRYKDFFRNAFEVNPTRVTFLIDGMDQVPIEHVRRMISFVSEINRKGSIVVMTSNNDLTPLFKSLSTNVEPSKIYKIPPLSYVEMEQFLAKFWGSFYPDSETPLLIRDYAKAVALALDKVPIARTPSATTILAEKLLVEAKSDFLNPSAPGNINIPDYVKNQLIEPSELVRALKHMRFNKMSIYDALIDADTNLAESIYDDIASPKAMKYIFRSEPPSLTAGFSKSLILAENKIFRGGMQWTHPYLAYENGNLDKFKCEDYANYYAAEFLLSSLTDESPQVDLLRLILEEPKYAHVLEFVNSGFSSISKADRPIETLLNIAYPNDQLNPKILDNLIQHGFDEVCYEIFLRLDRNHFKSYIHDDTVLETRAQYSLGLLAQTHQSTDGPSTSSANTEVFSGTRREMLIKMGMTQSVLCLNIISPYFGPQENVANVARVLMKQPNWDIYKSVMQFMPELERPVLNELLFDSIDTLGIKCQEVIQDLRARGANPLATSPNGRSLVHAAVQWRRRDLLRFVVEDLHVPVVDHPDIFGRTVMMTALSTNTFPHYSQPRFWEMMAYLMAQMDLSKPLELPATKILSFLPDTRGLLPEHYKLFTGSGSVSLEDAVILGRIQPIDPFRLSPQLNLRLNVVLQKCLKQVLDRHAVDSVGDMQLTPDRVSYTEILLHHRGVDKLLPAEDGFYHEAVKATLRGEIVGKSVNQFQLKRIVKVLVDNIGNTAELVKASRVITEYLLPKIDASHHLEVYSIINTRRFLNIGWVPQELKFTFATSVLLSRAHLNPDLERRIDDDLPIDRRVSDADSDLSGYESGSSCMAYRRRRDAGCRFSSADIDEFAEGTKLTSRAVKIYINRFLEKVWKAETMGDLTKARQLTQYLRNLIRSSGEATLIGSQRALLEKLLERGTFSEHFAYERVIEDMNTFDKNPTKSSSQTLWKMTFAQRKYLASASIAIPIVKSFFETAYTCYHADSNNYGHCALASGMLTLSLSMFPVSHYSHKFAAIRINKEMDAAVSRFSQAGDRQKLEGVRAKRLDGAARKVDGVFLGIGIMMDVISIGRNVKAIIDCLVPDSGCTSRDIWISGLSIGLSVQSIVVQGLVFISRIGFLGSGLVGLALMVIEASVLAGYDVYYYHTYYNTNAEESTRIFFRGLMRLQLPEDIQSLTDRTDWINQLDRQLNAILEQSGDDVVAYCVGIGSIQHKQFLPSGAFVNMVLNRSDHTWGLSRVLPNPRDNVTRLCLPRQNTSALYDKKSQTVQTALYKCENAFVLAHAERWRNRNSERSTIVFNTDNIDRGEITGSDTVNNLFTIGPSTSDLKIIGGPGKISNLYVVRNDQFHGTLVLHPMSRQETIDLSTIRQPVYFFWHEALMGSVLFVPTQSGFNVVVKNRTNFHLHVVGRARKPDHFQCKDPSTFYSNLQTPISVDGGGGSESDVDTVANCQLTRMRPYTSISGMGEGMTYFVQVVLETSLGQSPSTKVYSSIHPHKSRFVVQFSQRPILMNTYSVQYHPVSRTLSWEFGFNSMEKLHLDITPYRTDSENDIQPTVDTCLFVDSYLNVSIYPVVHFPADGVSTVDVHDFHLYALINSSRLEDVQLKYFHLMAFLSDTHTMNVVTQIMNINTNETFVLGSSVSNQLYIQKDVVFVDGGDGSDIYTLAIETPEYVWINNEANDLALDVLFITDDVCDTLTAQRNPSDGPAFYRTEFDVRLTCFSTKTSKRLHVILQQYLFSQQFRHLIITLGKLPYILLPNAWIELASNTTTESTSNLSLALFISLDTITEDLAVILQADDRYVVMNVTDKRQSLVAERTGQDVALKRVNQDNSAFVVLKDFYATEGYEISTRWRQNVIFFVDEPIDDDYTVPTVLSAQNVTNLILRTRLSEQRYKSKMSAYLVYEVSATSGNVEIDHNHFSPFRRNYKIGVVNVYGIKPGDFRAQWGYQRTINLCASQICIFIKNWCVSSERRISRISFYDSYDSHVSIRYLDQLKCNQKGRKDQRMMNVLNQKIRNAQHRLNWSKMEAYNNKTLLIRCVGYSYADIISKISMFRLFGFPSVVEQFKYMNENCWKLFTMENLSGVSETDIIDMLSRAINIYQLSDEEWSLDQLALTRLVASFTKINEHDWLNIKSMMYNTVMNKDFVADFKWLSTLIERINSTKPDAVD